MTVSYSYSVSCQAYDRQLQLVSCQAYYRHIVDLISDILPSPPTAPMDGWLASWTPLALERRLGITLASTATTSTI